MNKAEPVLPDPRRPPEWNTGCNPVASLVCWLRGHRWNNSRSQTYCDRCLTQTTTRT